MIDPDTLEKTLAALRVAAYAHPEQRIAQVISNAFGPGVHDIFHVQDDDLLDALANYKD